MNVSQLELNSHPLRATLVLYYQALLNLLICRSGGR